MEIILKNTELLEAVLIFTFTDIFSKDRTFLNSQCFQLENKCTRQLSLRTVLLMHFVNTGRIFLVFPSTNMEVVFLYKVIITSSNKMCILKDWKQNSRCGPRKRSWGGLPFDPGKLVSVITSEQNQTFVQLMYLNFPNSITGRKYNPFGM